MAENLLVALFFPVIATEYIFFNIIATKLKFHFIEIMNRTVDFLELNSEILILQKTFLYIFVAIIFESVFLPPHF